MAWGPLGGDPLGLRNRLFNYPQGLRQQRILAALNTVSQQLDNKYGIDQIALAWILFHPSTIVPIIGTIRVDSIQSQALAEEIIQKKLLSRGQWYYLLGESVTSRYIRWEQLHSGRFHDVVNDFTSHNFGSPFGVDVPIGFTDFP